MCAAPNWEDREVPTLTDGDGWKEVCLSKTVICDVFSGVGMDHAMQHSGPGLPSPRHQMLSSSNS
jgi:hypothetical protein